MYMLSAMLFLTSIELHIHTKEAAVSADHGVAVSISNFSKELIEIDNNYEINVTPDNILKVSANNINLLAVFLLLATLVVVLCQTFIGRMRDRQDLLPAIISHSTPPLRAPPQ